MCWPVVFTMIIFPCDTLGVNFNCKKFDMKSPLCTADYVVKAQCVGYDEKCIAHPTRSQPYSCKFFAPLMSWDSILKWIVLFINFYANMQSWRVQHSTCWYSVQVHIVYIFSIFCIFRLPYISFSLLPFALLNYKLRILYRSLYLVYYLNHMHYR